MAATKNSLTEKFDRLIGRDARSLSDKLFMTSYVVKPLTPLEEDALCRKIDQLVKAGADINIKDPSYRCPLSLLVDAKCLKAAGRVLALGAKVDAVSLDGVTPLMRAARNGDAAMMRLLLGHGADIKTMANDAHDAELYAFELTDKTAAAECLKALTDNGLDVGYFTEKQIFESKLYLAPAVPVVKGALDLKDAVTAGNNLKIKELMDAGVRPDICVHYGDNSSLVYASTMNNVEGMALLIKGGANVNLVSPLVRKTALANAATHGKREACKLLIESGADPSIEMRGVGGDAYCFAALSKDAGLPQYLRGLVAEREWKATHPPPPDVTTAQPVTVSRPLHLKFSG